MNRLILVLLLVPLAHAAQLGDWGHFLSFHPKLHLHNPDGRAWTATLHLMRWPNPGWNPDHLGVRISGPDGSVVRWNDEPVVDGAVALTFPAGLPGTYTVEAGAVTASRDKPTTEFKGSNLWLETDLPRAVVWTGDPTGHAIEGRRFCVQPSMPRRWWFWVPPGTTSFTVRAQRADRWMSQREDFGFSVFTPRGQRITTLFGQPPRTGGAEYRQELARVVEVEPGADGRFWYIEMRLGDGHNHSKMNLSFEGVPPFVARSPEEWFDPVNGIPVVPVYDDDPFIQASYEPKDETRWPHLQHWVPCPALGDPDGIEMRGSLRAALWNPDDRPLRLGIGTYLPRTGMGKDSPLPQARVQLTSPAGSLVDEAWDVPHWHGGRTPLLPRPVPATGTAVAELAIDGIERCWLFTYPATPLVLRGKTQADGWHRFDLEIGTARNWYFRVPTGTRSFRVRIAAEHVEDIVDLEINAPDRVQARLYERAGEREVTVPAGLDGKIWHLRTDIGSASRLITVGDQPRYLGLYLTLELHGVPALLAPTWEQWFDPADPQLVWERTP